ncbi:hypothetical protein [Streptomyces sulphureus]|uniref:hypothetical protein n=1 Tax=Streptomyces sulphureus TaxID=47758 RepID=UPI001FE07E3B|nr:hypothetical protein [Streptomyces sulphureus]
MEQQTPECKSGTTVEFERDVFLLLLEAMGKVAKQERADVGTEILLSALVSGDSAAGSAIAPGMRTSSSLAVSIGHRETSVWISDDAEDGAAETRTTRGRSMPSGARSGRRKPRGCAGRTGRRRSRAASNSRR